MTPELIMKAEYMEKWRKQKLINLAIARERQKKYRDANPEKCREGRRKWVVENQNEVREYARKWRMKNLDKVINRNRKFSAELTASYVANVLKMPVSKIPLEVIELKRNQIKVQRVLKNIKQKTNENTINK